MVGRISLVALAFSLITCGARGGPDAGRSRAAQSSLRPAPKAPEGPSDVFDPTVVRVDPRSLVGRARALLAAAEPERAVQVLKGALPAARGDEASRLLWLLAHAHAAAGDDAAAARCIEPLANGTGLLSPWARLARARWVAKEDPAEAVRLAAPLASKGWAGRDDARRIEAVALVAAGRHDAAEPKLRALVSESPDRVGAATAGMPLAEILAARPEPRAREEALRLYRRVATRAPLADGGKVAEARAAEILRGLPAERRRALQTLPVEDERARARALFESGHYEEAEEAYLALVKRLSGDDEARCEAMLEEGRAIDRQRDRDRLVSHMKRVLGRCKEPNVRAWAHYYAGRAHAKRGRHADAIKQYEALEREAPGHRLSDDALFRAALAARALGDLEGMRRRLEKLSERYPEGDMRPEGSFMLAWALRSESEPEKALSVLDDLLARGPNERREAKEGRAAYWRGRTLLDLGRRDEAVEAFAQIAREWPLSYYARQSLARLDELAAVRSHEILEGWKDGGDRGTLTFPRREEMEEEPFERALELLRVGATSLARAEWRHMGFFGEGADRDILWLVAALLDRAGELAEASQLVRRRLGSFRRAPPVGRARALWALAYPDAYAPLIETVASAESVPPTFVRAVAREESAFDPAAVSIANAYGLIQLIRPTAARFAKELNLPSDPSSLKTPEINLRIGARFIAFLWKRLPNPALVPAAYNAGEGAVGRWLTERPDIPLDEWVESIPYDETRRYTRRVLQTHGVYSWFEEGRLPPLPSSVAAP